MDLKFHMNLQFFIMEYHSYHDTPKKVTMLIDVTLHLPNESLLFGLFCNKLSDQVMIEYISCKI